jgi:hypothetical protein
MRRCGFTRQAHGGYDMTSRFKRATFTVVSFAGLVLVGLLLGSLNAGRVNAQRIDAPPNAEPVPIPHFPTVTSHPTVRAGDRYPVPQRAAPARFGDHSGGFRASESSKQPIVVTIKDGPQLRGEPVGLGALHVNTIFGTVNIPLDRIAGVRTADDPQQPATICLSNGDSLTGVLGNEAITINTQWGTATIARNHMVSIVTTTEPVTWQQHEGRWRISPVEPQPSNKETGDTKEQAADANVQTLPPQPGPVTTAAPDAANAAPAAEPTPSP